LDGGAVAEAIRQATATEPLKRGIEFDAPYRGILDTLRRERETEAAYKSLASNAWALSVTDTARTLATQNSALVEQQRHLASSVLDTVRAFDANKSLVACAIAAASVGDTYRKMVAEALPRFATFGAIAERMLMIDTMTARLSDGVAETATAFAARTVIEMQRVAEAIADAEIDAESSELQESMLDLIVGLFSNLGPNTIPQLQRMGLVKFAGYICTFLGLVLSAYALIPHEQAMGPQEKAAFAEMSAKLDQSLAENRRYHEAAARSGEAFLSRLPRAELTRAAPLRSTPARDGEIVLKAPKGIGAEYVHDPPHALPRVSMLDQLGDPSATCANGGWSSASGSASSALRSPSPASWPSSCPPCWSPANRSRKHAPQPDTRARPRRKALRDVLPGRGPTNSTPFVASDAHGNGMRDEPWRGRPEKPHHAAAHADREDDHAPGNDISENPCTRRN
jgi:hypothetical protein